VVDGRSPIALSGESGIAAEPHVHWAVYVHGVAVDPRVMERLLD
jgi:murein DD-endopeptidase MepM/ murein hydrolase activator NlpD